MGHLVLTEVQVPMDPLGHQAPPVLLWGPTTQDPTTRGPRVHSECYALLAIYSKPFGLSTMEGAEALILIVSPRSLSPPQWSSCPLPASGMGKRLPTLAARPA